MGGLESGENRKRENSDFSSLHLPLNTIDKSFFFNKKCFPPRCGRLKYWVPGTQASGKCCASGQMVGGGPCKGHGHGAEPGEGQERGCPWPGAAWWTREGGKGPLVTNIVRNRRDVPDGSVCALH